MSRSKKKALITGIGGQDGSYLAEFLLAKGYEVHGMVRRVAIEDTEHKLWRIKHLQDRVILHVASLESFPSIFRVVNTVRPDECYHLAAQSFVAYSFDDEFSIMNTNINGTHYILAAIKEWAPECRFYFAATSEMFGNARETPQAETTEFRPRSSYGISKVAGYHLTRNYRENYGLKAWCGILYNHESPRRGYEFVTRKITSHVARIKLGLEKELRMGNLDAKRDWGHAKEYVKAMWMMLQNEHPDEYVISTDEVHSVREFLKIAFSHVGLNYEDHVVIDPRFMRYDEGEPLMGDSSKAKKELGWRNTVPFEDLVREMVDSDLDILKEQSTLIMSVPQINHSARSSSVRKK
jgi:GDPmannose 4,6-dehydratase